MAEEFHVIANVQNAGVGGPGGRVAFSKAEVEAQDKRFTAAITINGPYQRATIVSIIAESAAEAAKYVKYVLKLAVTGVAPAAESPITDAEAGKKPLNTVKTTGYEKTEAV